MKLVTTRDGSFSIVGGKFPHYKYVDRALANSNFEELWWLFKNAESPTKEISESYAALSAMKRITRLENQIFLHIGDGSRPRTGGVFAFNTKSYNISIDPQMANRPEHRALDAIMSWMSDWEVKRLEIVPDTFQNFVNTYKPYHVPNLPYNIICIHSHVDLVEVDTLLPNWVYLYTSPCCFLNQQTFPTNYMAENGIRLLKERENYGILSTHRRELLYVKHIGPEACLLGGNV